MGEIYQRGLSGGISARSPQESDVNGCHYYSVADYLERRWHLAFERIAIRRLSCEKMEETELAQARSPRYTPRDAPRYTVI